MVLLLAVGVDIVTRWAFNFSFEVSDEVAAICWSPSPS